MFQLYPPKTKFDKKYGWQYAPINMIFDVKQKDLRHKARLVIDGHIVDSTDNTTYSSTIKYVSVRLMTLIAMNNGLGIISGYIGNEFCT